MTKKQIKMFWPRFNAACRELGLKTVAERDEYRDRVLWEEAKSHHLHEVTQTEGFERVMTRLAADSGDMAFASRMAIGSDRRMAALIDDCARQVFELSGNAGDRASYARAILSQSGVEADPRHRSDWWMDYPEDAYMRVFYSLDTHRRRLIRRRMESTGARLTIRYRYGRTWK